MQVYRGMDIGTAKPSSSTLNKIPHHLIDILPPSEQFSVGDFLRASNRTVSEILSRGKIPVVSGGTAYYLRAFAYGLSDAPRADRAIRLEIIEESRLRGLGDLYRELTGIDPGYAAKLDPSDRVRIVRAIEVYRQTGRPLSSFTLPSAIRSDYRILQVGVELPRQELYDRINLRVSGMIDQGLENEVHRLLREGYGEDDPGMRGIGYREFLAAYGKANPSVLEIAEEIRKNSRRYAKRQLTFFRSFPGVTWIPPDPDLLNQIIDGFLNRKANYSRQSPSPL